MWVHTCKRARPGPERPYKSGPSPVAPQPLSAMSQTELPLAETKPQGVRPHICCAPPPRAPTSLGSSPLLARAEPRRGGRRPSQPAPSEPCAAERGAASPREPSDPCPSEPAPDGGWLSADESSGYESESAGTERSGGAAVPGATRGRQRRARTAFTAEQVCRLEKTFQRHKYLGASERRKLAAALQLSEIQIKTWFQNRRMKLKRQIQDHQHSLVSPTPLYNYPPGAPPALLHDEGFPLSFHYPFAPQHQRLLPFTPVPAVQFSFSFPRYDALQSTYRFMANELSYYHQHWLPSHPSFHPVIQNKMDKKCHLVYAL
ncbi:homeobox protein vent1-like isoform X2 [Oxyura jamaicensis]|nr:homeobox protein vent1-like isoform X2 [Oxyura jamaicensis]XP_035186542.1 homeobox protein vent1-like isoform X2 [Oxyura jamaicensis]XP_035186543.1 homeobox protein vent1-like isoform X2 [Oxyura jamaicensis]XP_035186544.1 homeobox protein vent1-like isoform X2 [Oxyura jamaicensis]XP_035186545.1 homeobox protein vent1-like isoform X2 [Oxyura jamaicensis]XP_035186546.1 homeobox protein vent1-like isoform X2 [Oxyura jamaicensis]